MAQKPIYGEVTVYTRSDACPYLDYKIDFQMGKYNLFHCALEGTQHPCYNNGWCPIKTQPDFKNKRIYILHDQSCRVIRENQ